MEGTRLRRDSGFSFVVRRRRCSAPAAERAWLPLVLFLEHQNQQWEKVSSSRREREDWRSSLTEVSSHGGLAGLL
jgi:hypothetical protein